MADDIDTVLERLPEDLRPAARQLWERSSLVTKDVTETLAASFALLQHLKADPQQLEGGHDRLTTQLRSQLDMAKQDIDRTRPALAEAWSGQGAGMFTSYIPQLLTAVQSCQDNVDQVSEAVGMFHQSVAALWTAVVERTRRTTAEVVAAVAAGGNQSFLAAPPVMDVIDKYADYVEELTKTLLELTNDKHAAGTKLTEADTVPPGWIAGAHGEPQLPHLSAETDREASSQSTTVSVDAAAMAQLTETFTDNSRYWRRAADYNRQISDELLKPESFGLAGIHFSKDLQRILERDRGMYAAVGGRLQRMAEVLRAVADGSAHTDAEVAAELRQHLDDVE
ncbi:MAG TPA: WXG100 family type VII secretion target [Candidatus Stackebrandtia faecavium]|nr:WXG100 family type VII secretion target [Candidatus Stackebrandtia faecavium]